MILIPDKHQKALFTTTAVGINLVITLYCQQLTLGAWALFLQRWGMVGSQLSKHPETLLTAQFLHTGFIHCLSNLLFLWVFGVLVEEVLGEYLTLAVYLVGGSLGYLAFAALNLHNAIPLVGASSAIATLMGVVAVLKPKQKLKLWLLIMPPLEIPAWCFLGIWAFLQASNITTPMASVAYASHVVGFATGACFALALTQLKQIDHSTD